MNEQNDSAEIEGLLRQLLPQVFQEAQPQIQKDLVNQYSQKFRMESEAMLAEQLQAMESQAQLQYEQVLAMIHKEKEATLQARMSQLQQQQYQLELMTRECMQKQRQKKLQEYQQQYLLQNFESEVLNHPYFCQLRGKIQRELKDKFEEKFAAELTRRQKELLVRLKQKEDKEFEDMQHQYRQECNRMVSEAQQKVDAAKVELARLRSQSNVKVKRFATERKEFEEKFKKDSTNYQKIVDTLEAQLLSLETHQLARMNNEPQLTSSYRNYYEEPSQEEDESSPEKQPNKQIAGLMQQKMVESSSSDEEQPPYECEEAATEDLKLQRPTRHRILDPQKYLIKFLSGGENSNINIPQRSTAVNQSETFEKDLSKYLPTEVEYSRGYSNQHSTSNFRDEYEKQLKKLGSRKTKLSAAAKSIILQNIMKEAGGRKRNTSIFSSIR